MKDLKLGKGIIISDGIEGISFGYNGRKTNFISIDLNNTKKRKLILFLEKKLKNNNYNNIENSTILKTNNILFISCLCIVKFQHYIKIEKENDFITLELKLIGKEKKDEILISKNGIEEIIKLLNN